MKTLDSVDANSMRSDIPAFRAGDNLKVLVCEEQRRIRVSGSLGGGVERADGRAAMTSPRACRRVLVFFWFLFIFFEKTAFLPFTSSSLTSACLDNKPPFSTGWRGSRP